MKNVLKTEPVKLEDFTEKYSLCALSSCNKRFVIIKKFASRKVEGKVEMLNAADIHGGEAYPIPQFGMTLVTNLDSGTSIHNVILPNSLNYESVELNGYAISINHSAGTTTTNFGELDSLKTSESFEEEEILSRFNALVNPPK